MSFFDFFSKKVNSSDCKHRICINLFIMNIQKFRISFFLDKRHLISIQATDNRDNFRDHSFDKKAFIRCLIGTDLMSQNNIDMNTSLTVQLEICSQSI